MPPDRLAQRLPDWPERLAAFIEMRRGEPFAWGRNDCITFAFDAWRHLTGVDALAALRGAWADEAGALRVIASMGTLPLAMCKVLGQPMRARALASVRRGALVCASTVGIGPGGARKLSAAGVLLGAHWCAPGRDGLVFRPAAEVRLAWGG